MVLTITVTLTMVAPGIVAMAALGYGGPVDREWTVEPELDCCEHNAALFPFPTSTR